MLNVGKHLGLVYKPTGSWWHQSHCQNPFAQELSASGYRIHFAGRDEKNRSRGGWADVEVSGDGIQVIAATNVPSLDLGRLGAFDDAGVMPSSLIENDKHLLLYYTGWTLARAVPFFFFIGVAESTDGGKSFRRLSEAPCLGCNKHDPFLTGAPWVIREKDMLRMWYISGTSWTEAPDGGTAPVHYYTVKHAISANGIDWETNDKLCLPYLENEHAIARPIVTPVAGGYRMIYSARRLGETYRIFTAHSKDGLSWIRDKAMMLDVSSRGWDTEMTCYGSFLNTPRANFLLYNGNAYGKDGFGAVLLEKPERDGPRRTSI